MSTRFNLETETGEVIPFASAAALLAFVERRMAREDEDE